MSWRISLYLAYSPIMSTISVTALSPTRCTGKASLLCRMTLLTYRLCADAAAIQSVFSQSPTGYRYNLAFMPHVQQ